MSPVFIHSHILLLRPRPYWESDDIEPGCNRDSHQTILRKTRKNAQTKHRNYKQKPKKANKTKQEEDIIEDNKVVENDSDENSEDETVSQDEDNVTEDAEET